MGWIFTGQTDGLPFDHQDHPQLSFLSEHVVNALENAIKHQEILSQKTLGENLLQLMPTAVITVDAEGHVTWCNATAEKLFPSLARDLVRASAGSSSRPAPRVPVENLGSRIASLVRDALAGEPTREPYFMEERGVRVPARSRSAPGSSRAVAAASARSHSWTI